MFFSNADKISGITKDYYLKTAKRYAKQNGYDPNLLKFSSNPKYKLNYNNTVNFGSSSNLDYIFYKSLEKQGLIDDGEAEDHRRRYLARASKIKGNWKNDKQSKNNLSMRIIWNQ